MDAPTGSIDGRTHILARTLLPPLPFDFVAFAFQHLARLGDGLMEEVQLAEDKTGVERITGPRAHIDNIEALADQIPHRDQLLED